MHLRKNINFPLFIQQVKQCSGEVLFCTTEGDVINLKSTLSQLVFMVIAENPELLYSAEVKFENEEDRKLLEMFFNE